MANQWKITEDHINEPAEEIGLTSSIFDKDRPMPVKFRMYDDDMTLYFTGVMEEQDFHPLDDFGMGGYGCTTVETNVGNGWEIL